MADSRQSLEKLQIHKEKDLEYDDINIRVHYKIYLIQHWTKNKNNNQSQYNV